VEIFNIWFWFLFLFIDLSLAVLMYRLWGKKGLYIIIAASIIARYPSGGPINSKASFADIVTVSASGSAGNARSPRPRKIEHSWGIL